jgi:hypothetical protein
MVEDSLVGKKFWPHTVNPSVSDVLKLGDKTCGCQSGWVEQTLSAESPCTEKNESTLS